MDVIVHDGFESTSQRQWRNFRPIVGIGGVLAIAICALLCFGGLRLANLYEQQIASADALPVANALDHKPSTPVVRTTSTPEQPGTASTHATEPVQTCVPRTASVQPTRIDLKSAPDGLTRLIDTPDTYQIYGTNAATLRSQIRQCAPHVSGSAAQFTAQTVYRLTWQYSYTHDSASMCRVIHAKVGIHVGQIMPNWQVPVNADAGLASRWQAFMVALSTHENGHTAIDTQYAQALLDDLNNFPLTNCDQMTQAVNHLVASDIATLDQANDNYDSATHHGATQGAILP